MRTLHTHGTGIKKIISVEILLKTFAIDRAKKKLGMLVLEDPWNRLTKFLDDKDCKDMQCEIVMCYRHCDDYCYSDLSFFSFLSR